MEVLGILRMVANLVGLNIGAYQMLPEIHSSSSEESSKFSAESEEAKGWD